MPELPEVETVCRGLARALTHTKILHLQQRRADLRTPLPSNLPKKLAGRAITSIARRAKYILMHLDQGDTLVLHLGMSGRVVISSEKAPAGKHDHLIFTCANGQIITFNDPRRFGLCDLIPTDDLANHKLFSHLGLEPLDDAFNAAYLMARLKNKSTAIKIAIMDQSVVVGVGNIYASEALFYAGVRPDRLASSLTREEITKLVASIRKVLKSAIKAGGSSLRDYVGADGELGYFQNHHAVYDRVGMACKECTCSVKKKGGVERLTQGGRSSFFCARKQK